MKYKLALTILLCTAWTMTVYAQKTVESINDAYQSQLKWISLMTSDEDNMTEIPPEYYDLHVVQNLPATGAHHENIRMFYYDVETGKDEIYPPHYLSFATAKYNFAAREFYEEYLYNDKGQVVFILAITPDVDDEMNLYELRMWFDGKRLLHFTARKATDTEYYENDNLKNTSFEEVYSGKTIPEMYRMESDRCRLRAKRFLTIFKGIDENTYL